jgi:hypothetical protein
LASRIENARITSTSLGYEDHGIMTAFVYLEGDGWGVGFGGYALDGYDKDARQRWAANGFGLEFIRAVMRVAGVEQWEKLPGKVVRVDTEGAGGRALRLGHFLKDDWFDPKELAERFQRETANV